MIGNSTSKIATDKPNLSGKQKVARGIVALSVLLYFASLYSPVFKDSGSILGFYILFFGWFTIPGNGFAWFANPCLWIAWIGLAKKGLKGDIIISVVMSLAAVALALTTFQLKELVLDEGGAPLLGYDLGFYLWLASIGVTVLGSLVLLILYLRENGSMVADD